MYMASTNRPIKTVYVDQSTGISYTMYSDRMVYHKDGVQISNLPSGWFKTFKDFEDAANDLLAVLTSLYRGAKGIGPSVVDYTCNGDV